MARTPVTVVLRYRKANTYGHHALLAALESADPQDRHEVRLARDGAQLVAAIDEAVDAGRQVLVAWSFYSPDFPAATAQLGEVRQATTRAGERVLHVVGGVHATAEPLVTARAGFDAVAVGEGETTFVRLVEALAAGQDWRVVPGLAHLDAAGQLDRAAPAVAQDLDRYRSFPFRQRLASPIELTRGCIYACRFCQTPFMFRARFRHRSVVGVREHVAELRRRGLRDVRFITPTALSYGSQDESVNLDAVEQLLAGVREELIPGGRIFLGSFPSEVRPEHVTPQALRLLRRYVANDNLIIGAQSGSEEMLRRSHRGHGVAVVEEAVRVALAEGFTPNVDVIFGMPGETEDEAMATVALVERLAWLGARIHGHSFMPLPGTPWRDEQPAQLGRAPLAALQRLTSEGAIYGTWERQREVAAELADGRSPAAGHRIRPVRSRDTAHRQAERRRG